MEIPQGGHTVILTVVVFMTSLLTKKGGRFQQKKTSFIGLYSELLGTTDTAEIGDSQYLWSL